MHPDMHRYLDGEIGRDSLPPDLAAEAAEWDEILEDASELRNEPAPRWLEARVMASLPQAPRASTARRALQWLLQPREIQLRPATLLAGALAVAAGVALWPRNAAPPARPSAPVAAATSSATAATPAPTDAQASLVYVQFTITAPGAQSVEVAGDFNGWQPQRAQLRDPEGDGNWSGLVPLPAGVHKYMFVIDGRRWVSDPHAHRFVDDGFGMKNSLIAVAPPARSS